MKEKQCAVIFNPDIFHKAYPELTLIEADQKILGLLQ